MNVVNSLALVVDDDESICDIVAMVLEGQGFSVEKALSGEAALELIKANKFDIVFTDIQMDGISGFELMENLQEYDPITKVIVMTGYSSYDHVLMALKRGAYDYLEKPLEDHGRIISAAMKAYQFVSLARDNELLLKKLKASHSRLAMANSRLIDLNRQLRTLAIKDEITGVFHENYIEIALQRELDKYARNRKPLSLVSIHINNQTALDDQNDNVLHDAIHKAVARQITEAFRSFDIVGMFGKHDFIALLHNTPVPDAIKIATRLIRKINDAPVTVLDTELDLKLEIGVTGLDGYQQAPTSQLLLKHAGEALRRSTVSSTEQISIYPEDQDSRPDQSHRAA